MEKTKSTLSAAQRVYNLTLEKSDAERTLKDNRDACKAAREEVKRIDKEIADLVEEAERGVTETDNKA